MRHPLDAVNANFSLPQARLPSSNCDLAGARVEACDGDFEPGPDAPSPVVDHAQDRGVSSDGVDHNSVRGPGRVLLLVCGASHAPSIAALSPASSVCDGGAGGSLFGEPVVVPPPARASSALSSMRGDRDGGMESENLVLRIDRVEDRHEQRHEGMLEARLTNLERKDEDELQALRDAATATKHNVFRISSLERMNDETLTQITNFGLKYDDMVKDLRAAAINSAEHDARVSSLKNKLEVTLTNELPKLRTTATRAEKHESRISDLERTYDEMVDGYRVAAIDAAQHEARFACVEKTTLPTPRTGASSGMRGVADDCSRTAGVAPSTTKPNTSSSEATAASARENASRPRPMRVSRTSCRGPPWC